MTRTEKSKFLKASIGKSVYVVFYGQRSLSIKPVCVGVTTVSFKYDRDLSQPRSEGVFMISLYDINSLTLNERIKK